MKFHRFGRGLDSMTLVLKLDLDIVKVYVLLRIKFLASVVQCYSLINRQRDRHTDTHTDTKTHQFD